MDVKVSWNGPSGMSFRAQTGSGHMVAMDGAPEGGGHNLAPRPMEMVLIGTGGCAAYDVVLILKRGREDVRGCDVTLQAERADRSEGLHEDQLPLRGHGPQPEAGGGRARGAAIA